MKLGVRFGSEALRAEEASSKARAIIMRLATEVWFMTIPVCMKLRSNDRNLVGPIMNFDSYAWECLTLK